MLVIFLDLDGLCGVELWMVSMTLRRRSGLRYESDIASSSGKELVCASISLCHNVRDVRVFERR